MRRPKQLAILSFVFSIAPMFCIYKLHENGNGVLSFTTRELTEEQRERERIWTSILDENSAKPKRQRLPDVVCIGVEKCGTSALKAFLTFHPLIKISPGKRELHFFDAHYKRGVDKYLSWMPNVTDDEIVLEKTPSYFSFPPMSMPRSVKTVLPNAKLLLVLCDPVNRAYSDFVHEQVQENISKNVTFDQFIHEHIEEVNETLREFDEIKSSKRYARLISRVGLDYYFHVFTTGLYFYYLEYWFTFYSRKNIFIINGEDLLIAPGKVLSEIQDFLDLPRLILQEDFIQNPETSFHCLIPEFSAGFHGHIPEYTKSLCMSKSKGRTRNTKAKMSEETMNILKNFYRKTNEALYKLLRRDFGWQ